MKKILIIGGIIFGVLSVVGGLLGNKDGEKRYYESSAKKIIDNETGYLYTIEQQIIMLRLKYDKEHDAQKEEFKKLINKAKRMTDEFKEDNERFED